MAKESFDVIVSDVRMPGADDVELLNKVQKEFPSHRSSRVFRRMRLGCV